MDHRLVIEELVAQHTKAFDPLSSAKGKGLRALVDEWHNGAAPKHHITQGGQTEFPRLFQLADGKREEDLAGFWNIACALYTIEISIHPGSKKERELFMRAAAKLPPLATRRREVYWPHLREGLGFTIERTFRAMALGHHFEVWLMETPLLGYHGAEAKRLAEEGMVLVRPVSKDHESMKLRLFARR